VPLFSDLLSPDKRLRDCEALDSAHVQRNDRGFFVFRIQKALTKVVPGLTLPNVEFNDDNPDLAFFGEQTEKAVFDYKFKRQILQEFQKASGIPDKIVGKGTIRRLDGEVRAIELRNVDPPTPPVAPASEANFAFTTLFGAPMVIKQSLDDRSKQDLENRPVNRTLTLAKVSTLILLGEVGKPTEEMCKRKLLSLTSRGGPQAREMAQFFIGNSSAGTERQMSSFWSGQVKKDVNFLQNHTKQTFAIQDALKEIAKRSSETPKRVDPNELANGSGQPSPLKSFVNVIDFSFQKEPGRAARGDPLAFGVGSIQGLVVSLTEFRGNPDGSYDGTLRYELLDHYGADDSDVIDPGQASLWLLQRKMAPAQSRGGCEPFPLRIKVEIGFSGSVA
jgi:hypothetical protein